MERILEVIISIEATQYEYLKFFSADTNKVKFKFIGIDTSNCNATLSVTDSKNNIKEYLVDSSFIFNVPTSLLADRYSCNLKIYNTVNQRVTSYPFYLYIDQEPTPKTPIESDTNYPVLGSLINEVRELESTVNFNENTRNTNEAERILNENTRKENEEKRQAAYKEVTDLRKGVDGKVYKSANERVNNEVDQLQTQISNASNLPFSGENIKAEHSVKGVCKDMIVKGKTLQNLLCENRTQWIVSGIYKKTDYDFESIGNVTYPNIIAIPTFGLVEGKTYTMLVYVKASIKPINSFITYRIKNQDDTNNDLGNLRITELDKLLQGMFLKSSFIASNYNVPHKFEGIQFALNYSTAEEGKGCLITFKPMLLEGDWTNKDIPSYFEGIKSVAETSGKLSVLSCGELFEIGTYDASVGALFPSNLPNTKCLRSRKLFPVIDNATVTVADGYSIAATYYNSEKKSISHSAYTTSHTLLKSKGEYARFAIRTVKDMELSVNEIGKIKPISEVFNQDKRDITLTNGLREWDFIDFNFTELVTGMEKKVFKGGSDEAWRVYSYNVVNDIVRFNLVLNDAPNVNDFWVLSDNFKRLTNLAPNFNNTNEFITSINKQIFINIAKSKLTGFTDSLSDTEKINLFKKWLQANPTTVYYQLNIPIKRKIDNLDDLTSCDTVTNVFTSEAGEISPNITCKIPCNTPAVIQSLSTRNMTLQEENKALNNALENNKLNSLATNVDQEYRLLKLEMGV